MTVALREQILDGHRPLGPGLDQRKLAEEFGVSVVPLREGLRRLEAEGLIELHARRGAFVSAPGAEELRELSTIRQLLDPLATEKGAERMSDVALAHLARLIEDMRRETERATSMPCRGWIASFTYRSTSRPICRFCCSSSPT